MKRPSIRPLNPSLHVTLAAVAALGVVTLLPHQVSAQAMGGLGQRSSGAIGSRNAPAAQPEQQSPRQSAPPYAPAFSNQPTYYPPSPRNNNAPIFSQPGNGFPMPPASVNPITAPPVTVAPIAPPPFSVNPSPVYNSPGQNNGMSYPGAISRRRGGGIEGPGPGSIVTRERDNGTRRFYPPNNLNDNGPIFGGSASVRVTTPIGQRTLPRNYYNNDYLYNAPVTVVGGPALLGGYYYGNYCDTFSSQYCYPSVFSIYYGFPRYIVSPSVIVIGDPYYPAYYTSYLPFYTPSYQVTYNQNNYYVSSEEHVRDIEKGGEPAKQALKASFPADSYQAAFADIERAWNEGRITPLRKHLREDDVKMSIFFKGKYTYSISSADFSQITRDAFDRLNTVSFRFTRLRKAKNGDVTAYGKHVYRTAKDDAGQGSSDKSDDTVPFSTDNSRMYDNTDDPAPGEEKTAYVSYTLRRHDGQWYIIGVNSSPTDFVK